MVLPLPLTHIHCNVTCNNSVVSLKRNGYTFWHLSVLFRLVPSQKQNYFYFDKLPFLGTLPKCVTTVINSQRRNQWLIDLLHMTRWNTFVSNFLNNLFYLFSTVGGLPKIFYACLKIEASQSMSKFGLSLKLINDYIFLAVILLLSKHKVDIKVCLPALSKELPLSKKEVEGRYTSVPDAKKQV